MNKYYAIKAPDGTILKSTFETGKIGCKKWFIYGIRCQTGITNFKEYENKGYRCVKVEIKEII